MSIYPSSVCAELANYGEYSGAPSEGQTYEYAKTILRLVGGVKREEVRGCMHACVAWLD